MPDQPRHPHRRDVVVAALLDEDDRVLLVRTRRLPDYWQPVGGGVEPGDPTLRDAMTRELREELGLDLARDGLRFSLSTQYDFGDGRVHFFTARLPQVPELAVNHDEIAELRWSTVPAALDLPAYPATRQFLEHLSRELDGRQQEPTRSNGAVSSRNSGQ